MTRRTDVTGWVLAGGKGTRMAGADKGLKVFGGAVLVQHVLQRLAPQVGKVFINANRNLSEYAALGEPFGAEVVSDAVADFAGPLAGFERGLATCQTEWLVTAPCDSPFLPLDLVATLHSAARHAAADIAYPKTGAQVQPIFCLLRARLAPSLGAFLASGQRKIDVWTAQHPTAQVPFADQSAFANINTPDELSQWQTRT